MGGTRWACSAPPPRCSWPSQSPPRPGRGGRGPTQAPALRRFVVSIVPIAFGYHFAHYLPSFLVDAQYALKALSDPLARGWNLLGARDLHVTASFLTHHASVEIIWYAQAGAIVAAHRGRGSGPARPCGGVRARAAGAGPGRASAHRADDRLHPVRALAAVDPRRRLSLRRGSRRRGVLWIGAGGTARIVRRNPPRKTLQNRRKGDERRHHEGRTHRHGRTEDHAPRACSRRARPRPGRLRWAGTASIATAPVARSAYAAGQRRSDPRRIPGAPHRHRRHLRPLYERTATAGGGLHERERRDSPAVRWSWCPRTTAPIRSAVRRWWRSSRISTRWTSSTARSSRTW